MGRKEPAGWDSHHNPTVPFPPPEPPLPKEQNKRKAVKNICQKNISGKQMSDILHILNEMQELRKRAQRSDEIENMKTNLQIITDKSISGIKIR